MVIGGVNGDLEVGGATLSDGPIMFWVSLGVVGRGLINKRGHEI